MYDCIYNDSDAFRLFVHLLFKASFEDRTDYFAGQPIQLKKGQLITGRKKLSEETGLSEQVVRRCLDMLTKLQKINQQTTKQGSLISITYDIFEEKATNEQPTNNQQTTTIKELKKERIKENRNNNIAKLDFEVETVEHELVDFIRQNCPRVAKMKKPMNSVQASDLCTQFTFEVVKEVILAMENWEPLHKKSVDANLTCRNWLNRRTKNEQSSQNSTGQSNSPTGNPYLDWAARQADNPFLNGDPNQRIKF